MYLYVEVLEVCCLRRLIYYPFEGPPAVQFFFESIPGGGLVMRWWDQYTQNIVYVMFIVK
jgi:hypothetical protein